MVRPKVQSSSSRAADGAAFTFGSTAFGGGFTTALSPFSYLAELPDTSKISDPHTIVIFKNLAKRDSTTKVRALEELQSTLTSRDDKNASVETAVLEAWLAFYPRLSIDNTRRIRLLSQNVHGLIASAVGKGLAKHMQTITGPWLLGCHDTDQGVAAAAQEALRTIFTGEKLNALRKAYQSNILQTCADILEKESAKSLSDERVVSHDEAAAKYDRVLAGALGLLTSIIGDLSSEDRLSLHGQYVEIIANTNTWRCASSKDASVRRALNRFLRLILQKSDLKSAIATSFLSTAFVERSLKADQGGTAADLVITLTSLTSVDRDLWSSRWKGKKPASVRLREFLKSGSQGSSKSFWQDLSNLLSLVPTAAYPSESDDAKQLIEAFQQGISGRLELRSNQNNALVAFSAAVIPITSNLSNESEYADVLQSTIMPLLQSLVMPQPDGKWRSSIESIPMVYASAMKIRGVPALVMAQWSSITDEVVTLLKTSLPQSSKDYTASQERIKEAGLRWTLASKVILSTPDSNLTLDSTVALLLSESLTLCKTRNGKPYGAAVVAQTILKHLDHVVWLDPKCSGICDSFVQEVVPDIIISPSTVALCAILQAARSRTYFSQTWNTCMHNIASTTPQDVATQTAFVELLKVAKQTDRSLLDNASIFKLAEDHISQAIADPSRWPTAAHTLEYLDESQVNKLLSLLTNGLAMRDETAKNILLGLRTLAQETPSIIQSFIKLEDGQKLLALLLSLAQTADHEAEAAVNELSSLISKLTMSDTAHNGSIASSDRLVSVITNDLANTADDAVSVETLAAQASSILKSQGSRSLQSLAPDTEIWKKELTKLLRVPPMNLDMLNVITGISFVLDHSESPDALPDRLSHDPDGLSIPLRMGIYTVRILEEVDVFQQNSVFVIEILKLLLQTTILVNDSLSFDDYSQVWKASAVIENGSFADFVMSSQQLVAKWSMDAKDWWMTGEQSSYDAIGVSLQQLFESASGNSAEAYYASRCYETLMSQLISMHGLPQARMDELSSTLTKLRRSQELLQIAPFVISQQDFISSVPASRSWYNSAVADATGLDYGQEQELAMQKLVLLNVFLATMDASFVASAAQQRLVFLFRDTINGLEQSKTNSMLGALMMSVLSKLCEPLQTVYGDYWETLIAYIKTLWQDSTSLADSDVRGTHLNQIYESLRLYRALRRVSQLEDCNEDLTDALAAASPDLEEGLLRLLSLDIEIEDEFYQPLRMVREIIANEINRSSGPASFDPEALYTVLNARNEALQTCAFKLLHRRIPDLQAQISLDVAVEKTTASIRETLLSLTLEPPSDVDVNDLEDSQTQLSIKCYLYSWLLVFDHFSNSSHQLQTMYLESIRTSGDMNTLLDLIYALTSQAKLLAVKTMPYDVTNFDVEAHDTPRQEILSLLCHLYYSSLVHTSSLSKNWWLNAHRTVASNMETWTERHVTPHVIARAFADVERWSKDQESSASAADDKPLTIKANRSSREVIASYYFGGEDDERFVSICVSLPSTFPLKPATVISRNATTATFEARKWHSWLMIAQGAITFNNNSLPDGLVAWRRNVTGALQGKSECTICYSLVSEDGKLPNKECKTCKHAFHMLCLTKWFASSGDKKCPLCRSDFVGLGRVDRSGRRSVRED